MVEALSKDLIFSRLDEKLDFSLEDYNEGEYYSIPSNLLFDLTESEVDLFDLLINVIERFGKPLILRVAGGWVRDKIMGLECKDIDVAAENMMGVEVANLINQYLAEQDIKTRKVGVIRINPDCSKHLETATMKINNICLDLVNLRSEEYSSFSRIPKINIGSPVQDAERRDLTINSLYYNINNKRVEDWTMKGIKHLRDKILMTPLDPILTFLDDPLRILRVIRFLCRYSFHFDFSVSEAFKCKELTKALETKISRERIGQEINLILLSSNFLSGFEIFYSTELYRSIYTLPHNNTVYYNPNYYSTCSGYQNYNPLTNYQNIEFDLPSLIPISLEHTKKAFLLQEYFTDQDEKCYFVLSNIMLAFSDYYYTVKKKPVNLVNYFLSESLKFPKVKSNTVLNIFSSLVTIKYFLNSVSDNFELMDNRIFRIYFGRFLIKSSNLWKVALICYTIKFSEELF